MFVGKRTIVLQTAKMLYEFVSLFDLKRERFPVRFRSKQYFSVTFAEPARQAFYQQSFIGQRRAFQKATTES